MLTCGGCGKTTLEDDHSGKLPAGWTGLDYAIRAYLPCKVRLELCPDCSKNPTAALARFQAGLDAERRNST